jgi:thioredoxin reductase (NADPH)
VEDVKGEDGDFTIITDKDRYRAEKVIIATGFYGLPHKMNVPGEELPKVKHYFDEPHPYVDQDVLVVGGGNSAVDVALETYRCGANVTMVVREPELKPGVKYWVRPDIENRIKEGSIRCWFNSTVKEITHTEVLVDTPEGEERLPNDFVLAMTGYEPSFDFLKTMKLAFQDDEAHTPVYDEETMETSRPGVYMAGVVCGGLNTSRWFIENSIVHAEMIARDLDSKPAGKKQQAALKD